MNVVDILDECPCPELQCEVDFTIDEGSFEAWDGYAVHEDALGWDNSPSGAKNHWIQIEYDNGEEFNLKSSRLTIQNDETADIGMQIFTYDDNHDVLNMDELIVGPGETVFTKTYGVVRNPRYIHLGAERQGIQSNIAAYITKWEILDGDCVLPEQ